MTIRHVVDLSLITMNGEVSGVMSTKFRGKRIFNMDSGLLSLKVKLPFSSRPEIRYIPLIQTFRGKK